MRLIDADALLEQMIHRREYVGRASDAVCLVEDAPTVGGWISVKDRLPETSGLKVLVTAKTVPDSVLQTSAVFVAFRGYGDGKWYTPDIDFMTSAKTGNDNIHPVWEITHWMLPPEPPKE